MKIQWRNSDFIDVNLKEEKIYLNAKGCSSLLKRVNELSPIDSSKADEVLSRLTTAHYDLLIKEAILKILNRWDYPYKEEELCHCRMIETKVVDEAIVGGLYKPEEIGSYCAAGITCGNCRSDIENMLEYRLKKNNKDAS